MTHLFLLAHQDDEIGVMQAISSLIARGEKVVCAFLTNGAFAGVIPQQRNHESLRVLNALGVSNDDIHFLGERIGIADGRLVENLDLALSSAHGLAVGYGSVKTVIVHAWEGGHHDHDAAHLVGQVLSRDLHVTKSSRQFALYRAGLGGRGLRFAAPDPRAGSIESTSISFADAIHRLLLLRHYRSQRRVIAQLGPRAAWQWLIERAELLQALPPPALLSSRPAEHLLYERWKLYDYGRFRNYADCFIDKHRLWDAVARRCASRSPELVA